MGPDDLQQALVLVVLVIPGIVFQAARARMRGPTPDDQDTTYRVLRALGTSASFGLLYVVALGEWITSRLLGEKSFDFEAHPRSTAAAAIALIFVVPVTAALIVQLAEVFRRGYRGRNLLANLVRYDVAPTAWDKAAADRPLCFVRILTVDGRWIGGLAEEQSFLSAYPQPHDLYIEEAWELDQDGAFVGAVTGTLGMWVRCDDARLVQFLGLASESDDAEADEVTGTAGGGRLHTERTEAG